MIVAFVVAVAENGVIGRNGELPWRMPTDLRRFRRLTLGKPVIMGRKTYESIGKPLDGRDNIVISRDPTFRPDGADVLPTIDLALERARELAMRRGVDEVCVIGGGEIYRAALGAADRIYLTRVHAAPEGDASFSVPGGGAWQETARRALPRSARDDHDATLIVLDRHT
jgi:dihydrofolate reductase